MSPTYAFTYVCNTRVIDTKKIQNVNLERHVHNRRKQCTKHDLHHAMHSLALHLYGCTLGLFHSLKESSFPSRYYGLASDHGTFIVTYCGSSPSWPIHRGGRLFSLLVTITNHPPLKEVRHHRPFFVAHPSWWPSLLPSRRHNKLVSLCHSFGYLFPLKTSSPIKC